MGIISAGVGDMGPSGKLYEFEISMPHVKADIVCIQETLNANTEGG